MNRILVNHKNFSEVLAVAGLVVLADCLDSPITRCRFTPRNAVFCSDEVFRSRVFQFEHPDYDGLLQRISALQIAKDGDAAVLTEHANEVVTLDWFNLGGGFIGDKGNFSKADKLQFVKLHHMAFAELALGATDGDLFALAMDTGQTNYLTNMNLKKNYVDAGGTYDSSDTQIFAREFLLIIGLQNWRLMMTSLVNEGCALYGIPTSWTTPMGFVAALVGGGECERLQATVKGFGKDGLVLATATEIASEISQTSEAFQQ